MKKFAATCFIFASALIGAEDIKPVADPDLPQTFDANVAQPLLENPPFTRSINLSDSLVLTGIAYIDGKPVATIFDKSTKASYVVSEEPNQKGWKLAETNASTELKRTQAKIMIGGETVTIRYAAIQPSQQGDQNKDGRSGRWGGGDSGSSKHDYKKPSEEDINRYKALSDQARDKFHSALRDNREKMMMMSSEDRSAYVKTVFDKIEKEDGKAKKP